MEVTEKLLKFLKAEKGCIENNHDWCYEECSDNTECPYYISLKDKLEAIDILIEMLSQKNSNL